MKDTKLEVKIMSFLRKKKHKWLTTTEIWRKLEDKHSYNMVAITLRKLREENTILFDRYQNTIKKERHFSNIYRYKEDALDEIIV